MGTYIRFATTEETRTRLARHKLKMMKGRHMGRVSYDVVVVALLDVVEGVKA